MAILCVKIAHLFLSMKMIFPWMFDEVHALRPFKEAAELLAKKEDWPPLYDVASLNNNKVYLLSLMMP